MKVTVLDRNHDYQWFTADTWSVDPDTHTLNVFSDGKIVATFHPQGWTSVQYDDADDAAAE